MRAASIGSGRSLVVALSLLLGACGGRRQPAQYSAPASAPVLDEAETGASPAAPPTAQAPESAPAEAQPAPEPAPTTLAEAEAALEQARSELLAAFAAGSQAAGAPAADKKAGERDGGGCPTACKACASLARAADAVCRLAGTADPRCGRARSVLADGERRVSSCGCKP